MDRNRLSGFGWRGFGVGLAILVVMAGTGWAQGRGGGGERGGMGGMQGGAGAGMRSGGPGGPAGPQVIPPPAGGTPANPSGLPRAMGDDTLTQAVQRILVATMATNARGEALTSLHLRYELKMVDYKNKEHAGTYETWISKDGTHNLIHTDAYDDSDLTKGGSVWVKETGLRPLRIMEFAEVHLAYRTALMMAMRGDQKMKQRTVDGVQLVCGGQDSSGSVCFDPATGYVAVVIRDQEKINYEDWKQVGTLHVAGTVRKSFGKHELFEAKLVDASDTVGPDALAVPAGATQEPAGVRIDEVRGLAFARDPHPQVPPTQNERAVRATAPTPTAAGQALVQVYVDAKGMVSKAVVQDADDKDAASAGYAQATLLTYVPYQENGKAAAFETTYYARGTNGFGGGMGGMRGGGGMGGGMEGGGGMGGGGGEGSGNPTPQ